MQRFTISIPGTAGDFRVLGGISSGAFGAGTVKALAPQDGIRVTFTDEQAVSLAITLLSQVRDSFGIEDALVTLGVPAPDRVEH